MNKNTDYEELPDLHRITTYATCFITFAALCPVNIFRIESNGYPSHTYRPLIDHQFMDIMAANVIHCCTMCHVSMTISRVPLHRN